MKMDINFSDSLSTLIFGGLAFIFVAFVKVERHQDDKISLSVPQGNRKYLVLFGILFIFIAIFLSADDSEQQNNNAPITINNNLTQNIRSEQRESVSIVTLTPIITPNMGISYLSNDAK